MTRVAATVAEYLDELPEDCREVISAVRKLIRRHLPAGYRESIEWGVISYEIPLRKYRYTYNGKPLCYVALAAQKNYCSLYLMSVYGDVKQTAWLKQEFKKAKKKLDMGKSCVRFRTLDDLPLDAIATIVASTPVDTFIARYEAVQKK
jgi:hypothetical protein